jgi:hypothetical protein
MQRNGYYLVMFQPATCILGQPAATQRNAGCRPGGNSEPALAAAEIDQLPVSRGFLIMLTLLLQIAARTRSRPKALGLHA